MKDNPYLILCPCCGKIVCFKCGQFEDRINVRDDQAYVDRAVKDYRKHLETYDHSLCLCD